LLTAGAFLLFLSFSGANYNFSDNCQKAEPAYRMCLSIDTPEYKTSLGEKARAGLNRLKRKIVRI
jgi:hypothetical protein